MVDPASTEVSKTASIIHEIAGLVGAIVWPAFALFVLLRYRKWISQFLPMLTEKFRSAESFEALGVKLTAAKTLVDAAINQPTIMLEANGGVPQEQVKSAEALNAQLQSAGVDRTAILVSVEKEIARLAMEYSLIRSSMPQGAPRTREMNRIMGSLRTLGIAAKPLLPKLTISDNAGERLAGIAILQTDPDATYLRWLGERFNVEQPFVFFHAALALREAALIETFADAPQLRNIISNALDTIRGFRGGHPDVNTINILNDALAIASQ